jgi:hypothetical protein
MPEKSCESFRSRGPKPRTVGRDYLHIVPIWRRAQSQNGIKWLRERIEAAQVGAAPPNDALLRFGSW